jgi:hypothetical protein
MSVTIYSEDENRFLSDMEGADPLIVGFSVSGTWGFHTSGSWVFHYPNVGSPHVLIVLLRMSRTCASTFLNMGFLCIWNVGLDVPRHL